MGNFFFENLFEWFFFQLSVFVVINNCDIKNHKNCFFSNHLEFFFQCELRFMYRLFGEPGAAIVVTTQHRTLNEADRYTDTYDYEDDSDWTRPTLHSTFNVQHSYIDS